MDIFSKSDEAIQKEKRDGQTKMEFEKREIKFILLSGGPNFSEDCLIRLLKIKELFQVQLPKMPREYILRQIFDHKHKILCMYKEKVLIGAVCFRPFYAQNFCEIVFLAVNFNSQIKGNGGFMMNVLKELLKKEIMEFNMKCEYKKELIEFSINDLKYQKLEMPVFFMTYADNSAIGFFRKQGFTQNIKFDGWVGYIKDYEGGTLMECRVYWDINYLNIYETIEAAKNDIFSDTSKIPTYGPLPQDRNYLKEIGIYKDEDSRNKKKSLKLIIHDFLNFLLADISSHSSAWPFLLPVNEKEVPDYYKVIKQGMDFSKMQNRIDMEYYDSIQSFINDFNIIINNCFLYNGPSTQYWKCAEKMNEYFGNKIVLYSKKHFFNHRIEKSY